jgi:hypothetical protein
VVSVPVKAFPDLSAAPLAGKTVIDTCNYGPERGGHIPELDGRSREDAIRAALATATR